LNAGRGKRKSIEGTSIARDPLLLEDDTPSHSRTKTLSLNDESSSMVTTGSTSQTVDIDWVYEQHQRIAAYQDTLQQNKRTLEKRVPSPPRKISSRMKIETTHFSAKYDTFPKQSVFLYGRLLIFFFLADILICNNYKAR